jgi:hypothetical protein
LWNAKPVMSALDMVVNEWFFDRVKPGEVPAAFEASSDPGRKKSAGSVNKAKPAGK